MVEYIIGVIHIMMSTDAALLALWLGAWCTNTITNFLNFLSGYSLVVSTPLGTIQPQYMEHSSVDYERQAESLTSSLAVLMLLHLPLPHPHPLQMALQMLRFLLEGTLKSGRKKAKKIKNLKLIYVDCGSPCGWDTSDAFILIWLWQKNGKA